MYNLFFLTTKFLYVFILVFDFETFIVMFLEIALNLSYGVIDNQILRATRLEAVLRGRKNEKKL